MLLNRQTSVSLVMPDQAYVGELIRVKLVVNDAQDLAGYQGTVNYNAAGLRLGGIDIGQDLARSGRDLMPLSPVERADSVVLGAVTCPVANCSTPQYDSSTRYNQGVDGYVELATLEMVAHAPGQYQFVLEDIQLVDPQANQLGAVVLNNVLEVTSR